MVQSLTVSEYSRQFFERTVALGYSNNPEENQKLAGHNFLNLIRKLQEAGSRDDIKVPLRVLRDEIGRIYFGSAKQRNEKIETLFKLYDALEEGAQADLRSKEPKQSAAAAQVLEELRQRFSRLVVGDTWDAWPELKLIALRRMHTYSLREKQVFRDTIAASPPPTPAAARLGMRKLSRSFSNASAVTATWQTVIDELAKAPGTRLLPIIKLLLIDETTLPEETRENLAAEANGNGTKGDTLLPQPSGFSEAAEVTRRVGDLDMDDLLGLNDAVEEPKPPAEEVEERPAPGPDGSGHAGPGVAEASPTPFHTGGPNDVAPAHAAPTHGAPTQAIPPQPTPPHAVPPPSQSYPYRQSSGGLNGTYSGALSPGGSLSGTSHAHLPPRNSLDSTYGRKPSGDLGSFERNAFGSRTSGLVPSGSGNVGTLLRTTSSGTASTQPGGFNPFGLPSPTYATPVPSHIDNNFADFSPVAGAPPPPPPQPMRAPPPPPTAQFPGYQHPPYQQHQPPYHQGSYQQHQEPHQQHQAPYHQGSYQQHQESYQQPQGPPYQQHQEPFRHQSPYQQQGPYPQAHPQFSHPYPQAPRSGFSEQ